MVFKVLWHLFTCIETGLDFGVSYVTTHYDGSVEAQAGGHRVFAQFSADFGHRAVEVDFHCITFTC